MRANQLNLIILSLAALLLFSCSKKTEEFTTEPVSDYLPLQVGKEFIYRLDSLVFLDHGSTEETHYYQEKQVVDAIIPDALGRPSFRIFRYLRDSLGTTPWYPAGTYFITQLERSVEVIDNNQRIIKLQMPLKQDFSWKGNNYMSDEPFMPYYEFENDYDIEDWDYTYASLDGTERFYGKDYAKVLTVNGVDRSENVPLVNPGGYASMDYIQDKYASGIGMIYQKFIMWEYQPPNVDNPSGAKIGFGVTRVMIDHK